MGKLESQRHRPFDPLDPSNRATSTPYEFAHLEAMEGSYRTPYEPSGATMEGSSTLEPLNKATSTPYEFAHLEAMEGSYRTPYEPSGATMEGSTQ